MFTHADSRTMSASAPLVISLRKSDAKNSCEPDERRRCMRFGESIGATAVASQTMRLGGHGSSSRRFAYDRALSFVPSRRVVIAADKRTRRQHRRFIAGSVTTVASHTRGQPSTVSGQPVRRSDGRCSSSDDAIKADTSTTASHARDFGR